jgi:hypothetical protein
MKSIKYILLITLFFYLATTQVQAVAIKAIPSEIKIKTESGTLIKKELLIENPSATVALYEVYVDNFSDWIKVKPESFTLESGESQKIVLEIKNEENGIFSTTISAVARPLSQRKLKANSGVKIPLEVRISEREGVFLASVSKVFKGENLIYFLFIILLLALTGIFLVKKERRTKKI